MGRYEQEEPTQAQIEYEHWATTNQDLCHYTEDDGIDYDQLTREKGKVSTHDCQN